MAVIEVFAGNILNFGWVTNTNIKILSVSNAINFTAGDDRNLKNQSLNAELQLSHTARRTYGRFSGSVASALSFFQGLHPRTHVVIANNYFALYQDLRQVEYDIVVDALNLEQVIIVQPCKGLFGSLVFDQTAIGNIVIAPVFVSTLALGHGARVYKMDKNFGVTEVPLPRFFGDPTEQPREVTFVKVVPGGDDVLLTLPRPEFDNSKRFDFTRINRRSRGGDLIIYRDEIWPKTKTLTLTFSWLPEQRITEILNFLKDTLGTEIVYNDHYGRIWNGFIMTPAAQISFDSKNDRNITLEFQGVEQV